MTRKEAQAELAESLMLLAEALLNEDNAGEYKTLGDTGELEIKSVTRNSTTIIAIKNWNYEEVEEEDEDEWPAYIG